MISTRMSNFYRYTIPTHITELHEWINYFNKIGLERVYYKIFGEDCVFRIPQSDYYKVDEDRPAFGQITANFHYAKAASLYSVHHRFGVGPWMSLKILEVVDG